MPLASAIVEELAGKLHYYNAIIEEQAIIWRKSPELYRPACERVAQSSFVCQPGQIWMPAPADRQAYMEYVDSICKSDPKCRDDVKKVYAAHAALACFMRFTVGEQPQKIQGMVIKRMGELHDTYLQQQGLVGPPPFKPRVAIKPYMGRSAGSRKVPLTKEKMRDFSANPLSLVGKEFVLAEETAYKVVGVNVTEDKMVYRVQFIDCASSVEFDEKEFTAMLSDSILVD